MPVAPKSISTDLPCCRCSYNLRGLTSAGRCPECALPVQLSLYADTSPDHPLAAADPAYLRSLARSVSLMLAALAVAALTPAVQVFLQPSTTRPYDRSRLVVAADLLTRALICCSVLLLTRPEPNAPSSERSSSAILVLRVACIGALLAPVVVWLADWIPDEILWLPVAMAALITFLATGPYFWLLGTFAERLPAGRQLDDQTDILFFVAPAAMLLSFCVRSQAQFSDFPLLAFGFPADDFACLYRNPFRAGVPVGALLGIAPAAVTAWSAVILLRLWRTLRELTDTQPNPES